MSQTPRGYIKKSSPQVIYVPVKQGYGANPYLRARARNQINRPRFQPRYYGMNRRFSRYRRPYYSSYRRRRYNSY